MELDIELNVGPADIAYSDQLESDDNILGFQQHVYILFAIRE